MKPATLLAESLLNPVDNDLGGLGVELADFVAAVVVLGSGELRLAALHLAARHHMRPLHRRPLLLGSRTARRRRGGRSGNCLHRLKIGPLAQL